jgi:DHA3 family macrolide efflux protein-like MFS transporter
MQSQSAEPIMTPSVSYPLRGFFTIWIAQAFSLLGSQLVQFALIWYLTEQTGSATVLAIASFVGMVPAVVLGPVAGALVDRWSRRWVMFWADGLVALSTAALAMLFAVGAVEIWHIYAALLIRAIGGSFHWPAMSASTSLMVPPDLLTRIAGLNQMVQGGTNIVSAPLGALLVATLPMTAVLAIDVGTALIAMTPLLFIAVPQPPAQPVSGSSPVQSVWADMVAGFRYVWAWRGLRILCSIAIAINFLLAPALSLLPIFVVEQLQGGALELGWLNAAWGAGVIAGGLLLSVWGGFKKRMLTTFSGLFLQGLAIAALGYVPPHWVVLALFFLFLSGVSMPITNGTVLATMQTVVAPEMQGRVFTLTGSLASVAAPLALLMAGPAADWIGVRPLFWVAGIGCMALALYCPTNKELMQLDSYQPG